MCECVCMYVCMIVFWCVCVCIHCLVACMYVSMCAGLVGIWMYDMLGMCMHAISTCVCMRHRLQSVCIVSDFLLSL